MPLILNGVRYVPGFLSPRMQADLMVCIQGIVTSAPLFQPKMPRTGKPFSVRMTNSGSLGWVSDKDKGYRYQATHPETGEVWPDMPGDLREYWRSLTDFQLEPEVCLINFYDSQARMGLHRDEDEADMSAPVISLSLGDSARFRIGGVNRKDSTHSFKLNSGDAVILEGASRLAYHGVDRILVGSSKLVETAFPAYRRINLTLRRVS